MSSGTAYIQPVGGAIYHQQRLVNSKSIARHKVGVRSRLIEPMGDAVSNALKCAYTSLNLSISPFHKGHSFIDPGKTGGRESREPAAREV